MVKDWGMSEKIGLRTMVENPKSFQGETLGPSTNEMVNIAEYIFSLCASIFHFRLTAKSEGYLLKVMKEQNKSLKYTRKNTKH